MSCARVIGVLVRREVEDSRVVVEGGLCAVAVVDIEVDDGDALEAAPAHGMTGGDGDVVEEAEAHSPVRHRVVSRRPHQAEGAVDIAVEHGVGGGESAAGRAQSGVVGARRDVRVGVGPGAAPLGHLMDRGDVGGFMHHRYLVNCGVAGRERDEM
jgi:hypothetical protein